MNGDKGNKTSHLFLVRLWLDRGTGTGGEMSAGEVAEGTVEAQNWYGKVQHVITGRAGAFDSQASMLQLLASNASLPIHPLPNSAIRSGETTTNSTEDLKLGYARAAPGAEPPSILPG